MKRTILALAIASISAAAFVPMGQTAVAARPGDKPPLVVSGPTVAMETGTGILFSDFTYGPQHVAFSYAEVRHVSLTVTRSASDDPLAQFFVYRKVHRADGSTVDFCIAIVGPDHTNAVLEFDADGWFIQGAPGSDVVELAYGYTVTYPGLIE